MYEIDNDAAIERYHDGWDAHCKGLPCPAEADAAEGWRNRERDQKVVVVMPQRPEGYYHMPLDGEV